MPNNTLCAPTGKFRVIGVDLFESANEDTDYIVGNYESKEEAFSVADEHNRKRNRMDDVYYVYDDQGLYIRGNEAVGQKVSP